MNDQHRAAAHATQEGHKHSEMKAAQVSLALVNRSNTILNTVGHVEMNVCLLQVHLLAKHSLCEEHCGVTNGCPTSSCLFVNHIS